MIRTTLALSTAALALSLAGCGKKSDEASTPTTTMADNNAAMTSPPSPEAVNAAQGQVFANAAASSDAFEIATSNLALEKSQSSAVKRFAEGMIKAHTESTAKLKTASAAATPAITPDPTMTPAQQDKLTTLRAKSGADFDAAYAAEQVAAHQMTLDTLRSYAAKADVPALGGFANEMVPIVTAHLNMAKSLKP